MEITLLILVVSQGVFDSYLCGYFESYSGELSPVQQGKFTVKETIVETPITQSDSVFIDQATMRAATHSPI